MVRLLQRGMQVLSVTLMLPTKGESRRVRDFDMEAFFIRGRCLCELARYLSTSHELHGGVSGVLRSVSPIAKILGV